MSGRRSTDCRFYQARRQEMKWGGFVKKWTFPQRRVHYVQYQYFLFYILLIWEVRAHPTHPPANGAVLLLERQSGFGMKKLR